MSDGLNACGLYNPKGSVVNPIFRSKWYFMVIWVCMINGAGDLYLCAICFSFCFYVLHFNSLKKINQQGTTISEWRSRLSKGYTKRINWSVIKRVGHVNFILNYYDIQLVIIVVSIGKPLLVWVKNSREFATCSRKMRRVCISEIGTMQASKEIAQPKKCKHTAR